jgi:hypothetical protein
MVNPGEVEQVSHAEFWWWMQPDSGTTQEIGDEVRGDPWPRIRRQKLEAMTGEGTSSDGRGPKALPQQPDAMKEATTVDQRSATKCDTKSHRREKKS